MIELQSRIIWIIIEFELGGPKRVWVFDSEEKAQTFGKKLIDDFPTRQFRIGSEPLQ